MDKSEEMLRLEHDLNGQPELREKLDAEIKRIAEAGEAECDGEAMVKAAAALGYTITLEELERAAADLEKLDDDELDAAGGNNEEYCLGKNYTCMKFYRNDFEDEEGHDERCWTGYHCGTITLHTDSKSKRKACWSDYLCDLMYHIPKNRKDPVNIHRVNP